jgi:hypothetical protein
MYVRQFTILFSLLLLSQSLFAVQMDESAHDMVIQRLEMGLSNMEKNEPERIGILLRLADLLADRSRLKAMNEVERHCNDQKTEACTGAKQDRTKAIALYNEALPSAEKDRQGPVILQIAHLHSMNEQSAKSIELYNNVLKAKKGKYASDVIGVAHASLGEILFRKSDFKAAAKHFEAARRENIKNRGLVEYRLAWCQLNLGDSRKAIRTLTNLLEKPELMATQTTEGKTVDASFVQDVSKDLARFLSREKVGVQEITLLRSLSPEKTRKDNLYVLATESDRLGKKQEALQVWSAYVDEPTVDSNEKLEVQIRVAKLHYDMNKKEQTAQSFEKAMHMWRSSPCKGDEELCTELKTRSRQLVTAWNKAEKQEPTQNLFRSYIAYTEAFRDDVEMLHWGAVIGREIGKHQQSAIMFHEAAYLASQQLKQKPNDKQLSNIFEGSLLGEIEMAEASKDKKAQEAAYNFYLQLNPNGKEAFRVRYQRAQVFSSTNRHQEAFSEFHYLASNPTKEHRDLRLKSADLALDSLVALKDDKNLQVRSLEYARFFPERKAEYLKISRKATLTIVATQLKAGKSSDRSAYKASLAALDKMTLDGADEQERIKYYKNRLVIAQKALALDAVKDSAQQLMKIKGLSSADREWALEQKVWVAELQLNFSEAYRISQQMKHLSLSKADRELRLALLAELSGQSARAHHEKFLKLTDNARAANLVRITLIKDSRQPWNEFDKHFSRLKQTPDLLAGIALETYARKQDTKRAEKILKTSAIAQYPAGATLARHLDMKKFNEFDAQIRQHQILGYSDKAMQKSLKERLRLINTSERMAQNAISRRDWTLQALALNQMARENRRLYTDIMKLPIPSKLNAADKKRYQDLLKTQSEPYLARAEKIESQRQDMWSDSTSMRNLQAAYMTATPELQKIYRDEIKELAVNAPPSAKNRLQNLLNTPYRRPSHKDIMTARRELQANPFDVSKAQALRELEQQAGSNSMVAYLDERITQLKKDQAL